MEICTVAKKNDGLYVLIQKDLQNILVKEKYKLQTCIACIFCIKERKNKNFYLYLFICE